MKLLAKTLAIALLYVVLAQIGLLVALPPGNISIFWPPAGLAVTAVLLFRRQALPGIALGAFSANLLAFPTSSLLSTLLVCLTIATGSTLQAWVGALLIKRIRVPAITAPTWASMTMLFQLIISMALACLIASSVGLLSLQLAGLLKTLSFFLSWGAWWLGDVLGILVLTPLLLALASFWGFKPAVNKTTLLTFGLSVGAAVLTFSFSWQLETQRFSQALNYRTQEVADALQVQLKLASNDIESVARLVQANPQLTRQEFKAFVSPLLQGSQANTALHAVSWNPRFDPVSRIGLEQQARSDGLANFQFTERNAQGQLTAAGQRSEYVGVYYIEPMAANQAALGFDIATHPARRPAIEQARRLGQPVATAPIKLVQERGEQKGFLLLNPLFSPTSPGANAQQRSEQLLGFSVGVFRIGDLLEQALASLSVGGHHVYLFDTSLASGEQLLAFHRSNSDPGTGAPPSSGLSLESLKTGLYDTAEVQFASRRWLILAQATPVAIASGRSAAPSLMALAILLLGLSLTALLIQGEKTRQANQTTSFVQARLTDALDSASDGIALFDADHCLIQFNDSYSKLMAVLGVQPQLGIQFEDLIDDVPQSGYQAPLAENKKAWRIAQFLALQNIEYLAHTSEGDRWLLIRHYRTRDGGTLVVLNDQTEVKATTNHLLESQKMEAVGQMTGGLAHDFNNLLGIVIGRLDLLAEETEVQPWVKRDVTVALNAALRGAGLVKSLLAVARRQPLQARSLDLNTTLTELFDLLHSSAGASNALRLNLEPDLPAVLVDRSGLESALINLVLNARDAMPHGGQIQIAAHASQQSAEQLKDAGLKPGNYVHVSVTDSGQGMAHDVQQHAFDPFFTTKERGQGTGLGLAMVLGFAKQSGGNVTLSSQLGKGTVIGFYLPVATSEPIDTLASPEQALPRGFERLLVVDDEPELLAMTADWLERLGYQVQASASATEALEKIKSAHPPFDLLLTDVVIPGGMDGAELARRALDFQSDLRVIYLSGFPEIAGQRANLSPLIEKPYRRPVLALAVRQLLDQRPQPSQPLA
ncbi:MAG: CHASE domain-containing protein [Burkholderiaceae bacterium]